MVALVTSLQWGGIWPGILYQWQDTLAFCEYTGGQIQPGEIFIESHLQQNLLEFQQFDDTETNMIRHYKASDFEQLQKLLIENFNIGWTHEVLNKVDQNFDNFNGYGLSCPYNPQDVLILEHQNTLIGFCVVQSITKNKQAFFGPIGIIEKFRGKGHGSRLFLKAVEYLKCEKKIKMGLWTNDTIFNRFYRKLGLQKTFETVHVKWNI